MALFSFNLLYKKGLSTVWKAFEALRGALITGETSIYTEGVKTSGANSTHPFETENTVWEDLRFPMANAKALPGKEATVQAFKGGLVWKFADHQDQGIAFNAQTPHASKLGENLDFHIHVTVSDDGMKEDAENIKFDLTYSWAYIGGEFPAETTLSVTVDVSTYAADKHYLIDLGDVLESNAAGIMGVSGMLICSLTRDVSVANNYGKDVYLAEADFHYQIDTLGSRTESTK